MEGNDTASSEPLAPTLARHVTSSHYQADVYKDLYRFAADRLKAAGLDQPTAWHAHNQPVDLLEPHHPLDELVTTLLYRVSHAPYRTLLQLVQEWSEKEKQETIEVALKKRGPYDELLREFRCGYAFLFDILMDIGSWRDLHRHRRCQQVQQTLHNHAWI